MKVGIVTYDYDPSIGGLGIHVKRLINTMQESIGEYSFIILSPSANAQPFVPAFIRQRWNKKGGAPLFSLWLYFSLNRFIKKHELDLLHLQSGSGGVFLLRKPKIPAIATVHHTFLEEAAAYKWHPITYIRKLLMRIPEKRTYKLCDHIMAVSKDIQETLVENYGLPPGKVTAIENSIDLEKFSTSNGKREENHLLYVGRIEPRKGIYVLLKALKKVHASHPFVRLTIVGENMIGKRLHAMIKRNKVEDSVDIKGYLPEDEYIQLLSSATVLVVPSIAEGFGLVAAEGMAAGIPLIASNCKGLASLIVHEKSGLLFKTGDATSCAQAIVRALDNPIERDRWQREAKREALGRFNPQRQALSTFTCYERLIAPK